MPSYKVKASIEFRLLRKDTSSVHAPFPTKIAKATRFFCDFKLPFPPTKETVIRRKGCTFDVGPFDYVSWEEDEGYFVCKMPFHVWSHEDSHHFFQAVDNYSTEKGWRKAKD
jgi:hypothetical protein